MTASEDPFNLQRFVNAQADGIFETARAELEEGRKQSHWMWFIFPQHRDLGRSATAKFYGLAGLEEARDFAAHPVLGARLRQCCLAILRHLREGRTAEAILGPVDAMKLRSSMEIFADATAEPLFRDVLALAS